VAVGSSVLMANRSGVLVQPSASNVTVGFGELVGSNGAGVGD
jgi:hypothetical protein